MNDLSRLLCLAALAGSTAFAQTSYTASQPTAPVASDAAVQSANPEQPADAQLQATAIPPAAVTPESRLRSRSTPAETVLPAATVLRVKLVRPISTATAKRGEKFFATLTGPVEVNGNTIIPGGTSVTCRIEDAHGGRRMARKPSITIRALSAQLPSGEVLNFTASVIDTATPRKLDVDQEGRIRGVGFSPMDKVEASSLAGAGLIAGAVVAGPEGLFIGAGSGAALAAGHIMVKHHELTVPAGTELIMQLDEPATAHSQVDSEL